MSQIASLKLGFKLVAIHILVTEGHNMSFPHNFTKKYFFSKVRLVSDSARRDLSEETIKGWGLFKIALNLNWSSRSGPYHKVHYAM